MVYCPKCGKGVRVERTCPSCGYENPLYAKFCVRCGSQLEVEAKLLERPVPRVAPPALPVVSIPWPTKLIASLVIAVICIVVGWFALALFLYPVAVVCGLYVAVTQKQNAVARVIGAVLVIISLAIFVLYLGWLLGW